MNRRNVLVGAVLTTLASALTATPALAATGRRRPAGPTLATPPRRVSAPALPNLAAQLTTLPTTTRQVIIVHGDGYATTWASLKRFDKINGVWRQTGSGMVARIGSKGFSDNHVEGVPTTPTGVYAIGGTMYGIAANPGVRYPYHRLVENDWWNENSETAGYNTFQHGSDPGGPSEALWQEFPSYTHFAVIAYNMPPHVASPVPYKGSGIFLHQYSSSGGPTAGCVSLAKADLVPVLNWLNPDADPRIVLCPTQNLSRY